MIMKDTVILKKRKKINSAMNYFPRAHRVKRGARALMSTGVESCYMHSD